MLYTDVNTVLPPVSMKQVTFRDHLLDVKFYLISLSSELGRGKPLLRSMDIFLMLLTFFFSDKAYAAGKLLCERLKETIPRQLFEIAIQAAIGKKIIARET